MLKSLRVAEFWLKRRLKPGTVKAAQLNMHLARLEDANETTRVLLGHAHSLRSGRPSREDAQQTKDKEYV